MGIVLCRTRHHHCRRHCRTVAVHRRNDRSGIGGDLRDLHLPRILVIDGVGKARRTRHGDRHARCTRNIIVCTERQRNVGRARSDDSRDRTADVEDITVLIRPRLESREVNRCCCTVDLQRAGGIGRIEAELEIHRSCRRCRDIGDLRCIERTSGSHADGLRNSRAVEVDFLALIRRQDELALFLRVIGIRRCRCAVRIAHEDVCHLVARRRRIEVLRIRCRLRYCRLHGLAGGDADPRRVVACDGDHAVVCHIALHVEPRAWKRQIALGVKRERTVARIELLVPARDDEETVPARDRDVRILARLLDGAVRIEEVGCRDGHTETDLLRVHAADRAGRRGCAREVLRDHIRERDAARLEARRVDVRDVVADDIHAGLVSLQAGNSRVHGTDHNESLLCQSDSAKEEPSL